MKKYIILAVNPGSTSTKIALYENESQLFEKTIRHSSEELAAYGDVASQFGFRKNLILEALAENGVDPAEINVVMGRGGLLRPIPSGVYRIGGETAPEAWGAVPTSPEDTWNTVVCDWNADGYRLPTESEWEYACRAGATTAYSTGDTISDNTGWYKTNSNRRTHEVGKKSANAYGLNDMYGNVWEWCWDWYGSYGNAARTDPLGASSGSRRVSRGGGWLGSAQYVRSAYRNDFNPSFRNNDLGFRLVRPQV